MFLRVAFCSIPRLLNLFPVCSILTGILCKERQLSSLPMSSYADLRLLLLPYFNDDITKIPHSRMRDLQNSQVARNRQNCTHIHWCTNMCVRVCSLVYILYFAYIFGFCQKSYFRSVMFQCVYIFCFCLSYCNCVLGLHLVISHKHALITWKEVGKRHYFVSVRKRKNEI